MQLGSTVHFVEMDALEEDSIAEAVQAAGDKWCTPHPCVTADCNMVCASVIVVQLCTAGAGCARLVCSCGLLSPICPPFGVWCPLFVPWCSYLGVLTHHTHHTHAHRRGKIHGCICCAGTGMAWLCIDLPCVLSYSSHVDACMQPRCRDACSSYCDLHFSLSTRKGRRTVGVAVTL